VSPAYNSCAEKVQWRVILIYGWLPQKKNYIIFCLNELKAACAHEQNFDVSKMGQQNVQVIKYMKINICIHLDRKKK
jgi:hypothetical protein